MSTQQHGHGTGTATLKPREAAPPSARVNRVLATIATVPILAVCGFLVWLLPQLDPLGQGQAGGAIILPLSLGAIVLALLAGALRARYQAAECCTTLLLMLGIPSTLYLAVILSEW